MKQINSIKMNSYEDSPTDRHANEKILREINKGIVRDNSLKVETKSPNFDIINQSGISTPFSDLLNEHPVALSFHLNTANIQQIKQLNKVLSASFIKHIAIVADSSFQEELSSLDYVYVDNSYKIFNQFGLINIDEKQLSASKLNAVYLINTDNSIVYSKLNLSNEPINFISIIDTYTATSNKNKETTP